MQLDSTPVFVHGDAVGCLLVHGFTGGPWDLRLLADRLVTQGYSVSLPLLPGHGDFNAGLGNYHWTQWLHAVHDAATELRKTCSTIIFVGFSMGGALALLEMERQPADALVLLAPALGLTRNWKVQAIMRLLPVAKYIRPWWYPLAQADLTNPQVQARIKRFAPDDLDLADPSVQTELRQRVRIATGALDQFTRLTRRARRVGNNIQVPTLLLHGRHDRTIPPHYSAELYERLHSADKVLRYWERSDHQLVNGPEGRTVVAAISEWIGTHATYPS